MLFIIGLIGWLSLSILIIALSYGAAGCICSKYLCWCLSITELHFWIICFHVFGMDPQCLYLVPLFGSV